MAKLFDEIFKDVGSGDIQLVVLEDPHEMGAEDALKLRCHSLLLTQHPYFFKMLSATTPLREGLTREVVIREQRDEFLELIRFIYTGHLDLTRSNVAGLLTLADKYCIDEVVDICLKFIKENFDADAFFTFYNFTTLNSTYQEKLRDQLMAALRQRRNLCSITEDVRWQELPVALVEDILSQDDLPISSEAEVLTLIAQWLGGQRHGKIDVARLLGAFRKCDNVFVRVSDIESLMQALGVDLFSSREPRTGSSVWDPSFIVHRHEAAGPIPVGAVALPEQTSVESNDGGACHQLGPKDFLQQEPGWMYPGVHRCRVSLSCSSWSHRERRLLRNSQTPGLSKRAFECSPSKPAARERSPSPPPAAFQVRMPPLDAYDPFDLGQLSDGARAAMEQRQGEVVRRSLSQDKIDHELVEHQIVCGVTSGYQRHGVRISQRDRSAIYLVEDLNAKQSMSIGGTMSTVSFDVDLLIGEASKCGIRRCRFALLRNAHTLLEEWFDVSAKVALRFYISSSYLDKNSSFTVTMRWLKPMDKSDKSGWLRPMDQPGMQCCFRQ